MSDMKRRAGQAKKRGGNSGGCGLPKYLRKINVNAAGIDIGSGEHYVAVPEDRDEEPVRVFKCYTTGLREMAEWLVSCGVETVAMESTGVYWMPVHQVLIQYGLEVKLVNARHVKNVPGRKTDIQDCQWLQQLHSYGLLAGAFIPDEQTDMLRTLWRHRGNLVSQVSSQIHLMQKALTRMNLHLHKVLTDITGKTGMAIIRAIVAGERDPEKLASYRHVQVKKSEEEIAAALSGDYREDHLFTLAQALELYDFYQEKIRSCDERISQLLKRFETKVPGEGLPKTRKRYRRKNEPYFDLRSELCRLAGVDLTKVDGLDSLTALTILSECGTDMTRFPSEKHFASWLGLCPNNRKTGGKIIGRRTKKVQNRAAQALRLAAQSLHRSHSALGAYYRRMRTRLGAPKAITATAHKLARLVYRLLKYGHDYVDQGQDYYEQIYRERVLRNLKNRAEIMGYKLVVVKTGLVVS